ncbi:anthocyanin regulatory Lc protein-like [Zingiber officinale]|uniref:anthocyanin regulatory Lc protein-like n=1 Tax=Zingiber officinale TaxID=94328 RepID=UPI001C4D2B8A|nr:anthocyanin regulatory Lc protein-like [Zingiber officinale]
MCRAMDADPQMHGESREKQLRKQLAATVRKIQWSYAVFWSISSNQPGVLAWTDGYYNGEIKTRKTTQPAELNSDHIALQRSEELRELYESLSEDDSNHHTRRPSASLSPEDLTDTEWYYLVCMSFTFIAGQGLPGKAYANDQYVWLNNAQFTDSKIFSRALLAMSASIQTVLCIPFMNGVLEFGTTELILEDPAFAKQITSLLSELPVPVCSEQFVSTPEMAEMAANDQVIQNHNLGDDIDNSMALEDETWDMESQNPLEISPAQFPFTLCSYAATKDEAEKFHFDISEELNIGSPGDGSKECFQTPQLDDLFETNGLNCMSQTESEHFVHDEFSNCLHGSLNSNEYASLSFVDAQRLLSLATNGVQDGDDLHYARTLGRVLCNSKQVKPVSCFSKLSHKSSFIAWRSGSNNTKPFNAEPQKLLKKIIINGERLLNGCFLNCQEEHGLSENFSKEGWPGATRALSERKRREKLNEKFVALQSLIPSISKIDKASILGDTIDYLKYLEKRVQELESCNKSDDLDVTERTSDNYGNKAITIGRKALAHKRKASNFLEAEAEHGPIGVNVTFNEKEVKVVMHCPWRECLLLKIVESMGNFHLDPVSMQSSIVDDVLALTITSKFRGTTVASPGMIKRSLQSVICTRL